MFLLDIFTGKLLPTGIRLVDLGRWWVSSRQQPGTLRWVYTTSGTKLIPLAEPGSRLRCVGKDVFGPLGSLPGRSVGSLLFGLS